MHHSARRQKADLLQLELDRLDIFQSTQFEDAARGDRDAIRCSLEIMKHRADFQHQSAIDTCVVWRRQAARY
jgi:hypothetical protein